MTEFLPIHETIEEPSRPQDGPLAMLYLVILLLLLACAPPIVTLAYRAAF